MHESEEEEEEEDDITLQDLVAMETMDDADELDMNSDNSFQNESEIYRDTNQLRNDCSSINDTKNVPHAFAPRRYFGVSNIGPELIHSPRSPLQSYRNAMKHMTGKIT